MPIEVPHLVATVRAGFFRPDDHFGCRRNRTTADVQYFVMHVTHNVEVASATTMLTRNEINNQ